MKQIIVTLLGCLVSLSFLRAQDQNFANFYTLQSYYQQQIQQEEQNNPDWSKEAFVDFYHWQKYWNARLFPHGDFTIAQKAAAYNASLSSLSSGGCQGNWQCQGPIGDPVTNSTTRGVGRICSVAFSPANTDYVYCSSPYGGLWQRSESGGTAVSLNTDFLNNVGVASVAVDPTNTNNIVIATGWDIGPYGWGEGDFTSAGIYYSNDGGTMWNASSLTFTHWDLYNISKIIVDPTNPSTLWAVGHNIGPINPPSSSNPVTKWGNLFKSTDGGATWTDVTSNILSSISGANTYFWDIALKPDDHNTIYVSGHQVYKSTDGGSTWSNVTSNLTSSGSYLNIALNSRVLVSTPPVGCSSSIANDVYASNGSVVWKSTNGLTTSTIKSTSNPLRVASYHFSFQAGPKSDMVYLGGVYFGYSTNGGISFSGGSDIHDDIRCISVPNYTGSNDRVVFAGTDGGLFKSTDGGNHFSRINQGIAVSLYYSADASEHDGTILAGKLDNNDDKFVSKTWYNLDLGGDGGTCLISDNDSRKMITEDFFNDDIRSSYDQGATTTSDLDIATGISWDQHIDAFPIKYDYKTPGNVLIGFNRTYFCQDDGTSPGIMTDYYTGYTPGNDVYALAQCKSTTDEIIVGLAGGWSSTNFSDPYSYLTKSLYKSTDHGSTWTDISPHTPAVNGGISGIVISPTDKDNIWITYSGFTDLNWGNENVYHSTNGGTTWSNYSDGLPQRPTNCIVYQGNTNDMLYIGMDQGVYYRDNTMSAWQCYSNHLPNVEVKSLEILYCTNKLVAATWGRGVWDADLVVNPINKIEISSSATWNTNMNVAQDVQIDAGVTLTVNSGAIINMAKDHVIDIKPGGLLIVDGATITNGCGVMWGGIKVEGDATKDQFPHSWTNPGGSGTYQGMCIIKNHSTISYAATIAMWDGNSLSTSGGIIQASYSSFINNRRSGEFMQYTNTYSSKTFKNQSSFINCLFYVDDNYAQPYNFWAHITMWQVDGISVQGCTFQNNMTPSNIGSDVASGRGIISIDASFNVGDYCTDYTSRTFHTPCPTGDIIHSEFDNLYAGIDASDGATSDAYTVQNATFNKCIYGIYSSNINHFLIAKNNFINIGGNATIHSAWVALGIQNNGGIAYTLTENTFNAASTLTQIPIGTFTESTGGQPTKIYKNTYNNLWDANVADGVNMVNTGPPIVHQGGLQYLCNTYNNSVYNDELIVGSSPSQPFDGICPFQGGSMYGSGAPAAGNCFSHNGSAAGDINNYSTNNIKYYYYGSGCKIPLYYSSNVSLYSISTDNSCSSVLPAPPSWPKIGTSYNYWNGQLNSYVSSYNSAIDGGNTNALQTEINNATPAQTQQLFNDLMARSPYLSMTTINNVINRGTSILPNPLLYNVLAANPDDLQNSSMWSTLTSKPDPMSSTQITNLQQAGQTNTARTTLMANLSNSYSQLCSAIDTGINHFLGDSIIYNDSMLSLCTLKQSLEGDYESAKVMWRQGNISGAQNLLQSLVSTYNLQGTQLSDYSQLAGLYNTFANWRNSNKNIMQLTNSDVNYLYGIGNTGKNTAVAISQAILNFNYGYNLRIPITLPHSWPHKADMEIQPAFIAENRQLLIYPNPTGYFATIKWQLPPFNGNAILQVTSIDGKVIYSNTINNVSDEVAVNTSNWSNGIYIVTIFDEKGKIASEKLSVIK